MLAPLGARYGPLTPLATRPPSPVGPVGPPIAGLAWLLDASDTSTITLTGGLVSRWADKSGGGFDGLQTNATYRASYLTAGSGGINGLGCISNEAKPSFLTLATNPLATASAATLYWISQSASGAGTQACPVEHFGTKDYDDNFPYNGSEIYLGAYSSTRYGPISYPAALTTPQLYSVTSDNTTWTLRQGSTVLYTTTGNTFGAGATPGIGGKADGSLFWSGLMGEVGAVARVITADELSGLIAYSNTKWGTPS